MAFADIGTCIKGNISYEFARLLMKNPCIINIFVYSPGRRFQKLSIYINIVRKVNWGSMEMYECISTCFVLICLI